MSPGVEPRPGTLAVVASPAAGTGRSLTASCPANASTLGKRLLGSLLRAIPSVFSTSDHGGTPRAAKASGSSSTICRYISIASAANFRYQSPATSAYSSEARQYCSPRAVGGGGLSGLDHKFGDTCWWRSRRPALLFLL